MKKEEFQGPSKHAFNCSTTSEAFTTLAGGMYKTLVARIKGNLPVLAKAQFVDFNLKVQVQYESPEHSVSVGITYASRQLIHSLCSHSCL